MVRFSSPVCPVNNVKSFRVFLNLKYFFICSVTFVCVIYLCLKTQWICLVGMTSAEHAGRRKYIHFYVFWETHLSCFEQVKMETLNCLGFNELLFWCYWIFYLSFKMTISCFRPSREWLGLLLICSLCVWWWQWATYLLC